MSKLELLSKSPCCYYWGFSQLAQLAQKIGHAREGFEQPGTAEFMSVATNAGPRRGTWRRSSGNSTVPSSRRALLVRAYLALPSLA
jgi:hypothetical protein